MSKVDPTAARAFAIDVVKRLRQAGYVALWAGGCVRDELLGVTPKDYDIATNALPEQVRDCLGQRRTLPIGASFGVITALGPAGAGQIDVATFRKDAAYADGRRPESVSFTDAQEDAQRRDFTINGLFFDPESAEVIDYVGGQADLGLKVIRAIGNPRERFTEDKLRLLRAVRFAATFGFALDEATLAAVQELAQQLTVVSAERIAAEMRRMLVHPSRVLAVQLLGQTNLLREILPEFPGKEMSPACLQTLAVVPQPTFSVALALLLRDVVSGDWSNRKQVATAVCRRWKLSTDEQEGVLFCLEHEALLRQASAAYWPKLQRVLVHSRAAEVLAYATAMAQVGEADLSEINFCQAKLALPREQLNPPPLLGGDELKALKIPAGPIFKQIIEQVRDAQLLGQLTTPAAAQAWALNYYNKISLPTQ